MPFLCLKNLIKKSRRPQKSYIDNPPYAKRVSCSISHLKGSLTLEATLTLPLFIAGIIAFIFLIQSVLVQMRIGKALFNQVMKISGYAFYVDGIGIPDMAGNIIETAYIKKAVIDEVGSEFLDNSYIVGGKDGIYVNYLKEYTEGILDVELVYRMEVPFNLFGIEPVTYTTRARCHTWIGSDSDNTVEDTEYGYITANGGVYHMFSDCTYLVMSISYSDPDKLDSKYKPCLNCCEEEVDYEKVFYTKYGERYHSTVLCGNLHRNVFTIEIEKAVEKYELCTRCEKRLNYGD